MTVNVTAPNAGRVSVLSRVEREREGERESEREELEQSPQFF